MQETIQDLKTRRSCRGYKEDQISEEQLNQILEAGTRTDRNGHAVPDHGGRAG